MSLFAKPLIFVVISVLVVALVYSSISTFNVFAAPNAAPSNAECKELSTSNAIQGFFTYTKCCWTETDPNDPEGIELYYCQSCYKNGVCDPKHPASQGPTSPPTGPLTPGNLQNRPTLEQVPTTPSTPPPLFGRNEGAVLPETPPMFGQIAPEGQVLQPLTPSPDEGEEQAQSSAVSPTGYCASSIRTSCIPCDPGLPVADCTPAGEWPPVLSTGEGLAQGTQPPLKTVPPLGEIAPEAEQPEVEEQEEGTQDEGQEESSNEGQDTATGPLT